jgi:DNA-binding MarR family transcriptional regulator
MQDRARFRTARPVSQGPRQCQTLARLTLQDKAKLTPGHLITHLRRLEDAEYVTTIKSGPGVTARTAVWLTGDGRAALDRYTAILRKLLNSVGPEPRA